MEAINKESIVDRVKKLLNLAERNSNVHEAAAAMAKAQRLILEHKLASVDLDVEEEASIKVEEHVIEERGKSVVTWRSCLMSSLTKATGCSAVYSREDGKQRIHLFGTQNDVAFVSYAFKYLIAEIDRLCKEQAVGQGKSFSNNFRLGAAAAIGSKLKQARAAVVAEAKDPGAALIVLDKTLAPVEAALKERFNRVKKGKDWKATNYEAFQQGRVAGATVSIPGQDHRRSLGAEAQKLA